MSKANVKKHVKTREEIEQELAAQRKKNIITIAIVTVVLLAIIVGVACILVNGAKAEEKEVQAKLDAINGNYKATLMKQSGDDNFYDLSEENCTMEIKDGVAKVELPVVKVTLNGPVGYAATNDEYDMYAILDEKYGTIQLSRYVDKSDNKATIALSVGTSETYMMFVFK